MNLQRSAETLATELERATRMGVDIIAADHDADNSNVVALVLNLLSRRLCPARGGTVDSRNRRYRIHAAIFDSRQMQQARWDSRDGEPEGYVVSGLPGVWRELVDTAKAWHAAEGHLDDGGQLIGLTDGDMAIRSIRPTLSRHWTTEQARAKAESREPVPPETAWRLKYQTFDNVGGKGHWILRCDITPLDKES